MVLSTLLQNRVVLFPISEPRGPLLFYFRTTWTSIYLLASEPHGSPIYFRAAWSTLSITSEPRGLLFLWLLGLGLNPSAHLPLQPHFRLLLQSAIPASIPVLPALLGCHSKSGQVWPHSMEPIFSKLSRRPCNQGELLPSYILGGIRSHPPGSKHGHSYLT